jgi:L-lactate dehydrogenase complex protein LldE
MAADKTADARTTGAPTLLAGDLGCLLNLAGTLTRDNQRINVRHVAEILAGITDTLPPIGAPKS